VAGMGPPSVPNSVTGSVTGTVTGSRWNRIRVRPALQGQPAASASARPHHPAPPARSGLSAPGLPTYSHRYRHHAAAMKDTPMEQTDRDVTDFLATLEAPTAT